MCVLSHMCAGKDECKNHGKTSKTGQNRHENRKGREKPEKETGIFNSSQIKSKEGQKSKLKFNQKSKGQMCKDYQISRAKSVKDQSCSWLSSLKERRETQGPFAQFTKSLRVVKPGSTRPTVLSPSPIQSTVALNPNIQK